MSDVVEKWLKSGKFAEIGVFKLKPLEFPGLPGTLLAPSGGQAQAFYLQAENSVDDWILKKFLPGKIPDRAYLNAIQSLVPHRPGFRAGHVRQVLSKSSLGRNGFFTPEFASWIENTVLMSRIAGDDWQTLADKIRNETVIPTRDQRLSWCRALSEQIAVLEASTISHRDLSAKNVFVDLPNLRTQLIDWDCIFHPTLKYPINTTIGSDGYIAPFVKHVGGGNVKATWGPHADRFALAILEAEFLGMTKKTPLRHEGGMFEQAELSNRGGPETASIISDLKRDFPGAALLLERALQSRSFDECPEPAEWLAMSSASHSSLAKAATAATRAAPAPQVSAAAATGANSFVPLNEAAFVELDETSFVSLIN